MLLWYWMLSGGANGSAQSESGQGDCGVAAHYHHRLLSRTCHAIRYHAGMTGRLSRLYTRHGRLSLLRFGIVFFFFFFLQLWRVMSMFPSRVFSVLCIEAVYIGVLTSFACAPFVHIASQIQSDGTGKFSFRWFFSLLLSVHMSNLPVNIHRTFSFRCFGRAPSACTTSISLRCCAYWMWTWAQWT